jgi:hypothetical protein
MAQDIAKVRTADQGLTSLSEQLLTLDKSGSLVIIDFFSKAILDGHGYQVRAGTITTPLVGDVVITDTAAEFCVDPGSGKIIIPVCQYISIRLGTGTLHEYATKSVATASTAGTAFVLLPINGGVTQAAAVSTARVQAAGAVTVTAELATTTKRHWSYSQPIAMGAYSREVPWEPARPPVIANGWCLYTQIAATTTGPSYYANLDVLELGAGQIGA